MAFLRDLKNDGWNVTEDGFKIIVDDGKVADKRSIIANALNTDLKEFGAPVLASSLKQNETGKIVLQIQKIRNIAAPKSKEDSAFAPRMLKITLTDGCSSCQAVEITNIPYLSRNQTAPGSKILIEGAKVFSGSILLHPKCCTLLGGKVSALFERWETAKDISEHVRSNAGPDGPPLWVNFGQKIITSTANEPFKALASKETVNEFDVHRQDAIAIASTGAVKKVFGGGSRIASEQLNQQRFNRPTPRNQENKPFKKREPREKAIDKPQKPADKISLFDFLEDKLNVNDDDKTVERFSQSEQVFVAKESPKNYAYPDSTSQYPKQPYKGKPGNTMKNNYNAGKKFSDNSNIANNFNQNMNNHNQNSLETATKSFQKLSINSQFASRTLQQHLNLGDNKNERTSYKPRNEYGCWNWKVGDLCMAKYWEDGKYYNASVIDLTEKTCVVKFHGYGNVEEVLKSDCLPISDSQQGFSFNHKGSGGYGGRKYYNNYRSKPA